MVPFNDFRAQYLSLKPEIDAAVQRVLDRGWFILGQELEAFEAEFAVYLGAGHAVGVGSGTEALHLALLACGVQPGDEVITVSHTAVPTASAISFAGAQPVLVDIDPQTFTMDPDQLEARVSGRTRVIVPVHLYGHPADMGPIMEVARRYGVMVLEDAAQAHGAEYRGRKVGTLGDVAAFSFYPTKNLGAYGDAGAVVTNDPALADKVRLLRNYGQGQRYYHRIKGFNSRLDEMQAAILRAKLLHLDRWNEARRQLADLYRRRLDGLDGLVLPQEMTWAKHAHHLYVVRSQRRDELQRFLADAGVQTLIHYPVPVHLQEAYADLGMKEGDLPITEACAKEILSLPLYPEMSPQQVEFVAQQVRGFVSQRP